VKKFSKTDELKHITYAFEDDPESKSTICNSVLRSLPEWFGIEGAIRVYVDGVRDLLFLKVLHGGDPVGFCAVRISYGINADLYVLGILKEFHGRGIGTGMIEHIRDHCRSSDIPYMTVKTLSERHPDANYAKTRKFYEKCGFEAFEEFPTFWGESSPCLYMLLRV
jgi:ribosomal protein S18 acetylase RimI-like enzyme